MVAVKSSRGKAAVKQTAVVPEDDTHEEMDFVRKLKTNIEKKLSLITDPEEQKSLTERYHTFLEMEKDLSGAPGGNFEKKLYSVDGDIDIVLDRENKFDKKNQDADRETTTKSFKKSLSNWKSLKVVLMWHFLYIAGLTHVPKWQSYILADSVTVFFGYMSVSYIAIILGYITQQKRSKCWIGVSFAWLGLSFIAHLVALIILVTNTMDYIVIQVPFFIELLFLGAELFIVLKLFGSHAVAGHLNEDDHMTDFLNEGGSDDEDGDEDGSDEE